jgi:hypothetical protein
LEKGNLFKLLQEWAEGGDKRMVEGVNSSMMYLIYCKNFCKCHNVPPPNTTIRKAKIRGKQTKFEVIINVRNVRMSTLSLVNDQAWRNHYFP